MAKKNILGVKLVNLTNRYIEVAYDDFTMYLPYPILKNKDTTSLLQGIDHVIVHNEFAPDDRDDYDMWYICKIVDSCVTTEVHDPVYDDHYERLDGEYIAEFCIADPPSKKYYVGIGADIVVRIEPVKEVDMDLIYG